MALFCAVRVARRNSFVELARDTSHGRRVGLDDDARYDRDRRELNQFGSVYCDDPTDVGECVKASAKARGASFRKSTAPAFEALFIASQDFFTDINGNIDLKKVEQWKKETLEAVERKWPGACACWRLDLDETTPHLSAWVVPVKETTTKRGKVKRWVSTRDEIGKEKDQLSRLQDWYAGEMASLGLRRGAIKNPPDKHKTPADYLEESAENARTTAKQLQQSEQALASARRVQRVTAWLPRELEAGRVSYSTNEKGRGMIKLKYDEGRSERVKRFLKPVVAHVVAVAKSWTKMLSRAEKQASVIREQASKDLHSVDEILERARDLVPHLDEAERRAAFEVSKARTVHERKQGRGRV